eukprot:2823571-Pyramimonas_sp.AAC.1
MVLADVNVERFSRYLSNGFLVDTERLELIGVFAKSRTGHVECRQVRASYSAPLPLNSRCPRLSRFV